MHLTDTHRLMLERLAIGATYADLAAEGIPCPGASLTTVLQVAAQLRADPDAAAFSPAGVAAITPTRSPRRRQTYAERHFTTWDELPWAAADALDRIDPARSAA